MNTPDLRTKFIINNYPEDFRCILCTELVLDPIECQNCTQMICNSCIAIFEVVCNEQILISIKRCPACTVPLVKRQLHKIVKAKLEEIKLKCNCSKEILYKDLLTHQKNCTQNQQSCISQCGFSGNHEQLQEHNLICQSQQLKQCRICRLLTPAYLHNKHNCIKELETEIDILYSKIYEAEDKLQDEIKENKPIVLDGLLSEALISQEKTQNLIELCEVQKAKISQHIIEFIAKLEQSEQEQQQNQITMRLGPESDRIRCPRDHKVRFWIQGQQHAKNKQCTLCGRTNTQCRYHCDPCNDFFCLQCMNPEITAIHGKPTHCPASHELSEESEQKTCSVCEKYIPSLNPPRFIACETCHFALCIECLRRQNFNCINKVSCNVQ